MLVHIKTQTRFPPDLSGIASGGLATDGDDLNEAR